MHFVLAPGRLLAGLPDLLLTLVERFTVILVAVFIFYLGFGLVFDGKPPSQTRAAQVLEILNLNWRALLILAIPLFYRPVKKFLDEVQEIAGMKRPPQPKSQPPPPQPNDVPLQGG